MRRAYLLIDVDMGKSVNMAALVHDKPGVVFADTVNGPHDVIVVLEGTDAGAIAAKATQALRATDGVRHITTCFSLPWEWSQMRNKGPVRLTAV